MFILHPWKEEVEHYWKQSNYLSAGRVDVHMRRMPPAATAGAVAVAAGRLVGSSSIKQASKLVSPEANDAMRLGDSMRDTCMVSTCSVTRLEVNQIQVGEEAVFKSGWQTSERASKQVSKQTALK